MPILLSHFIDACRWVGALLVLAVHANNMFVNLADIMSAPHGPGVHAWWFVVNFGLGHQAVVGFFAVSGYLVGGATLAMLRERRPGLQDYFIHRVTRIYIVVVPALLLTAALDAIGRAYFDGSGVYERPEFRDNYGLVTFLGSLLSLQKIYFELYGSNGAMWSLSCEFWYYITFPLLLLPFARAYSRTVRAAGFALGVALLIFLSVPQSFFLFGFLLWALGALATLAPRPLMRSRWLALAIMVCALIPIRLLVRGPVLAAHPFLQDAADLLSALLFLNLVVTIRFSQTSGWRSFEISPTRSARRFLLLPLLYPHADPGARPRRRRSPAGRRLVGTAGDPSALGGDDARHDDRGRRGLWLLAPHRGEDRRRPPGRARGDRRAHVEI